MIQPAAMMRVLAFLALTLLLPGFDSPEIFPRGTDQISPRANRCEGQRRGSQSEIPAEGRGVSASLHPAAAFKKEGLLELWATGDVNKPYTLISTYNICATSGSLGPKRRFGDVQVPEGFYSLDWFNPLSNFFLSLHVSYPNTADRILGSHQNPGGDIFLHGNCVTIGCIPITDGGIKEVYWAAVLARNAGQRDIPIHIFPASLADDGYRSLIAAYRGQPELIAFCNLKEGFDYFEKNRRQPRVRVSRDGIYSFEDPGGVAQR